MTLRDQEVPYVFAYVYFIAFAIVAYWEYKDSGRKLRSLIRGILWPLQLIFIEWDMRGIGRGKKIKN